MPPSSSIEARIAEIAARQHGSVTRGQLLGAGLSAEGVRSRLRAGRLLRLHAGVYLLGSLVGPLRPPLHLEMAAVLACGNGGAVARRSALWLLDLLPARPGGPVHVVMRDGRRRRPGVIAHRTRSLPRTDVDEIAGIPTTTPIRSILDAAADTTLRELEQVIARAERLDRLDVEALRDRARREKGRTGIAVVRAILGGPDPAFTRSLAEEQLLALVRKADLPQPEFNVMVNGFELDAFWPDLRVAIEVDGFAHHGSRRSFERDRARDFALGAHGIDVQRVTWRQMEHEPFVVVRRLAAILARAEVRAGAWTEVPAKARAEGRAATTDQSMIPSLHVGRKAAVGRTF